MTTPAIRLEEVRPIRPRERIGSLKEYAILWVKRRVTPTTERPLAYHLEKIEENFKCPQN